jgi:tripartite-type tricarboxylate transporter receptor subunit TctC
LGFARHRDRAASRRELFRHRAGVEITHVPYRGANQGLMSDFLAGRLDFVVNTTGSLLEPVRSKQVTGLAVTSAKRFPNLPELPTVSEAGVSGFDVSSWYAIYAPAKTPPDIIAKINADMASMLHHPPIKEKFKLLGVLPQPSSPQELTAMNVADAALWRPIIEEANIKVE